MNTQARPQNSLNDINLHERAINLYNSKSNEAVLLRPLYQKMIDIHKTEINKLKALKMG